jgi:hypothetical protein
MTTCLTCRWCDPLATMNGDEAQGACRLNPPVVQMLMTQKGPAPIVVVPTVRLTKDYCSHHVVQLVKPVMNGPSLVK